MAPERPLVVISDENLLDEVLRLAAAVGCELQRAPDVFSARADWLHAPLVLVDEESLDHALPPRPGVLLVTRSTPETPIWQRAFDAGIDQVLPLPAREADLVSVLADVAEGPTVPGGCVIAVVGGRGGAGASVFAAALALTATAEHRLPPPATAGPPGEGSGTLLIDCDPLGGGLDMALSAESVAGARWPSLRLDGGRISMSTLRDALPQHQHRGRHLPFISCDDTGPGPTRSAVASVVDAARRAGTTVVCDLPRHLGPAAEAVLTRADLIVMVVPAEVRACAAASRVVAHLKGTLPLAADASSPSPDTVVIDADLSAPTTPPHPTPLNPDTPLHPDDIEALQSLLTSSPLLPATSRKTPAPDGPTIPTRDRPEPAAPGRPAVVNQAAAPASATSAPRTTTTDRAPLTPPPARSALATTTDGEPAASATPRQATHLPRTHASRRQRRTYDYSDRIYLVVRGPAPGGLTPQQAEQATKIPLLTSMPPDRKLAGALDRGEFWFRARSPLTTAARLTLAAARAEANRFGAAT